MAKIFDVASFFIDWANKSDEEHMTNLWLNKLLYFAQGQYLARYKEPLFDDNFEAWKLGPVVPSIYRKYNSCGRNPIPDTDDGYTPSVFSKNERDLLIDVLRKYGIYNANALVSMTHAPDTPWTNAYVEGMSKTISKAAMQNYFEKSSAKVKPFSVLLSTKKMESIGIRDSDGYLVLPACEDIDDTWDEL